ncbi:MAG TPA: hypothetical protein VIW67_12305 [Terriglobales bacterium]|jgi:hypothetical protein
MKRTFVLCSFWLIVGLFAAAQTSDQMSASDAHKVPVIDGAAGSCSVDLTVTADSKPVYAAKVKVHIAYGFGGLHKLDLEASTNVDGKVKFTGIPAKVRRSSLEFEAAKDQLSGTLIYDPSTECQAKHDIALEKTSSQPAK